GEPGRDRVPCSMSHRRYLVDDVGRKRDEHSHLAIERHSDTLPLWIVDQSVESKATTAVISVGGVVALLVEEERDRQLARADQVRSGLIVDNIAVRLVKVAYVVASEFERLNTGELQSEAIS